MIKIQPIGTKLLVKKLAAKEYEKEGVIIPENAGSNLSEGEVVIVSNEISHIFKEGDIVLFPAKKGAYEPRLEGEHIWLDARDGLDEVWGIVQK